MTCAQGLLRLLWGGPEVGVLRDCASGKRILLPAAWPRRTAFALKLAFQVQTTACVNYHNIIRLSADSNIVLSIPIF